MLSITLFADQQEVHRCVIPPLDPVPGVLRWNGDTFVLGPTLYGEDARDENGWRRYGYVATTGYEVVDLEPLQRGGGEARVVPFVEKTSAEIASIAGRGLTNPASLSEDEIRKVCGSAVTQAGS